MNVQPIKKASHSQQPQKIRRTPSEWRMLIDAYRQSGLTPREYCEKNKLAISTFHKWQAKISVSQEKLDRRFCHASDLVGEDLFVELSNNSMPAAASISWDVELALSNGMILRLRQA